MITAIVLAIADIKVSKNPAADVPGPGMGSGMTIKTGPTNADEATYRLLQGDDGRSTAKSLANSSYPAGGWCVVTNSNHTTANAWHH